MLDGQESPGILSGLWNSYLNWRAANMARIDTPDAASNIMIGPGELMGGLGAGILRPMASVPEATAGLHRALSDAFPSASVSIENAGGKTAYGNSGYVNFHAVEPDELFQARRAAWQQAGSGSGRGPEPVAPKQTYLSFRVSDHDVGDRRASQHVAVSPGDNMDDLVGRLRASIPWLAK